MMTAPHYVEAEGCMRCNGTGVAVEPAGVDGQTTRTICPDCNGRGFVVAPLLTNALEALEATASS